jgi:hypothetical protein
MHDFPPESSSRHEEAQIEIRTVPRSSRRKEALTYA